MGYIKSLHLAQIGMGGRANRFLRPCHYYSPTELVSHMAYPALVGRGWKVESVSTKTYLQGSLTRRGETYRVGIRLVWPKAEIGYVASFSQQSDSWLRNLEHDMIAEMEIARLGGG